MVFPDSSLLASGSDDTDEPQTIKLWDVASAQKYEAGTPVVARSPRSRFTQPVACWPRATWAHPAKCGSGTPKVVKP